MWSSDEPNPWSAYALPLTNLGSLSDEEWDDASVTSPMPNAVGQRASYLDKVRAGGAGGAGGGAKGGAPPPPSLSASSSTTPLAGYDIVMDGAGLQVDRMLDGKGRGSSDMYALENMVADTRGRAREREQEREREREWASNEGREAREAREAADAKDAKASRDSKRGSKGRARSSLSDLSSTCEAGQFLTVPSGKREQGEGCEDASQVRICVVKNVTERDRLTIRSPNDDQGILAAHYSPSTHTAVLQITYLAAGFLIGEKGQSIRDMERITNTTIKSWKDKTASGRPVRKLVIESERDHDDVKSWNVSRCLQIIKAAVMHYKDLCEGLYCGEYVEPVRVIEGVAFTYNPPPRKSVPYAAGIKVKASKVMDAYGGEVDGVPSKYKKEVVTDDPAWHRGGGAVEDILERKEATATDAVYPSDSIPITKKGRKKSRRRGTRKGEDEQGLGLGLEDARSDGNGNGDGLLKGHHPEFGLFEVPCNEDYQPRERNASRRQRPRITDQASDGSAQPTTAGGSMGTSHAWTNAAWGPHRVHPLRQQQQQQQQQQLEAQEAQMKAQMNAVNLHGAPWMAVHHYGHFSPMGRAPVPMPWTGVDTLSGVSQQSLMSGYDGRDGYDGYDGYGGLGGLCERQLIPSAWEDFSGYGYSSRMLRTNGVQEESYTRMNRSRSSHNVFAGYEFRGDGPERAGQGLGARRHGTPRRDPLFDNMFAEFSEKCSVGGSRWMDTPKQDGQHPRGNGGNGGNGGGAADKDHDEERARRRLKF